MESESAGQVGVLIARAWREGARDQLRIRITYRADVLGELETVAAVANGEELCARVQEWLDLVWRGGSAPRANSGGP